MKLREWLLSEGCTHAAMESTGVYWKPIFAILEGCFQLVVANAQQAYQYMGRRPDKTYTRLGLPCAAWFGGWVKDRDPYFKRYGGRRATWSVELCWTAPGKSGPTPHRP